MARNTVDLYSRIQDLFPSLGRAALIDRVREARAEGCTTVKEIVGYMDEYMLNLSSSSSPFDDMFD